MRALLRPELPARWARYLDDWTIDLASIGDQDERYQRAKETWSRRRSGTRTLSEVRDALEAMNGLGGEHCMYCEFSEAVHLDHFEPRQRAPERTYDWSNLFLSCDVCDGRKQSRFEEPETGHIPVSPTEPGDPPEHHLRFLPTGSIRYLTERGRWTCEVFALHRPLLRDQRRDRWDTLRVFIMQWSVGRAEGDDEYCGRCERLIRRPPFLSVLRDLVAAAASTDAELLGLADVAAVIERYPEVARWATPDPAG